MRKIKEWREAGEKLDWNRLSRELTALRNETEWLAEMNCHNTRSVLHDLKIAMQSFFKRVKHKISPAGFPRFKSRNDSQQGFFVPDRTAGKGPPTDNHAAENPHDALGTGRRSRCGSQDQERGRQVVRQPDNHAAGHGDRAGSADEPGRHRHWPEQVRSHQRRNRGRESAILQTVERKLAHWQRKLCRQKKGSNRRATIKKRIAKIHAGIANCRKHFSHLISKQVADNYDAACIESHSLKGQTRGRLAKSVHDVGHGHFRQCLAYKLPDRGKRLLEAEPYFKSTGICHVCGHNAGKLPLSVRKWTCPGCQTVHDRDYAASKTLEHEGRRQVTADAL